MARIEQRICDRCQRVDTDGTDHGWHELDVNGAQVDLCRSCSKDFILWVSAGVTSWPEDIVTDAIDRKLAPQPPSASTMSQQAASLSPQPRRAPVVQVSRIEPPRG